MTIEELKNEVLSSISDFASGEAKDAIVACIGDTVLPAVQSVADAFATQLKRDAAEETGWPKFRDTIFLPGIINLTLYLVGKAVGKMRPAEKAA